MSPGSIGSGTLGTGTLGSREAGTVPVGPEPPTLVASLWDAARDKFKYAVADPDSKTSLSSTHGPMGWDIGFAFQLPNDRIGYLSGDMPWATAAGQSRTTAFGQLVQNAVFIQTGLQIESATMEAFIGNAGTSLPVAPLFPKRTIGSNTFGMYPCSAIHLDDRLLVTGMASLPEQQHATSPLDYGFSPCGSRAFMCFNVNDFDPDQWSITELDFSSLGKDSQYLVDWQFSATMGIVDGGDGWLYWWGAGAYAGFGRVGHWRMRREQVKAGDLSYIEWWDGNGGYTHDTEGSAYRLNAWEDLTICDQPGAVSRRPDGMWMATYVPELMGGNEDTDPPLLPEAKMPEYQYTVEVSFAGSPGQGFDFERRRKAFDIPQRSYPEVTAGNDLADDFCYGVYATPIEWAGRTVNDVAMIYSRNHKLIQNLSDPRLYWCDVIKVEQVPNFSQALGRWFNRLASMNGEELDTSDIHAYEALPGQELAGSTSAYGGIDLAEEVALGGGLFVTSDRHLQAWLDDSPSVRRAA